MYVSVAFAIPFSFTALSLHVHMCYALRSLRQYSSIHQYTPIKCDIAIAERDRNDVNDNSFCHRAHLKRQKMNRNEENMKNKEAQNAL